MGLGINEETHICSHAGCHRQMLWLLFYEDNEMTWKKTLGKNCLIAFLLKKTTT